MIDAAVLLISFEHVSLAIPVPKDTKRPVIAVVDDDEAARESFAALLETEGYGVDTFAGGSQFLEALPSLNADCVLLDVRMPAPDGLAVLEELSKVDAHPPVILMSANPKTTSPKRARELGTLMVLEKPIEEACLFSAIRMALSARAGGT